jgi:hypothetical protein
MGWEWNWRCQIRICKLNSKEGKGLLHALLGFDCLCVVDDTELHISGN